MTKTEASDNKALRVVLFIIVVFACVASALIWMLAGWKAGVIALLLLMLPAATIYRYSGIKGASPKASGTRASGTDE
ncbi:hypothetical protein RY831_13250 [Noviherbaspirillum sp. CPCC 100848]|uniref:Transmembrane protein n=1 Tax=Noviherbaspirillum album TaxID=3080276 RepID=A0ABU6J920_9BURK|nr:hypothetical protein [Noviherbaspirillum sp. CPCC 100848]MEC4720124.1 hypothetical protein [Noviherbaspirillum sp. CPCC 100848]